MKFHKTKNKISGHYSVKVVMTVTVDLFFLSLRAK